MITLKLTDKEMDYIAQVLAQRPWGEVDALMENIKQQVTQQQSALPPQPQGDK